MMVVMYLCRRFMVGRLLFLIIVKKVCKGKCVWSKAFCLGISLCWLLNVRGLLMFACFLLIKVSVEYLRFCCTLCLMCADGYLSKGMLLVFGSSMLLFVEWEKIGISGSSRASLAKVLHLLFSVFIC